MNTETLELLLTANGFDIEGTGGGCTAWIKEFPKDGGYVMLTTDASHKIDPADCMFGVYDSHGECVLCVAGKLIDGV